MSLKQNSMGSFDTQSNNRYEGDITGNVWRHCVSNFRRSKGDLLTDDYVNPVVYEHMQLPPILATWNDTEPLSVHYFPRDDSDSDSEVECVAVQSIPFVPLRRDHSPSGNRVHSTYHTEFHV